MNPELLILQYAAKLRAQGRSEEDIAYLVAQMRLTAAISPAVALRNRLDDIQSGAVSSVPWPWPNLTRMVPSLLPGKLAVIAGSPGASKSFMILQCLVFWLREGYSVSALELEGTKAEHLQRVLAQLEENSNFTDLQWIKVNSWLVDDAYNRQREWLNTVGSCLYSPESGNTTYTEVLYWIQTRAKAGDRVIIVDPVTAADPCGTIWEKDRELISHAQNIAIEHKTSIIFVSHPKKGALMPSLDSLSNGAAYQRHTQCVLWLEASDPKKVMCRTSVGRSEIEINRIMHCLKVTDGMGQGSSIGFRFQVESLLLAEQGVIIRKKKEKKDDDSSWET
jgi:hypothetical protein